MLVRLLEEESILMTKGMIFHRDRRLDVTDVTRPSRKRISIQRNFRPLGFPWNTGVVYRELLKSY